MKPRRRRAPDRPWKVTTVGGAVVGTYANRAEAVAKAEQAARTTEVWVRHKATGELAAHLVRPSGRAPGT